MSTFSKVGSLPFKLTIAPKFVEFDWCDAITHHCTLQHCSRLWVGIFQCQLTPKFTIQNDNRSDLLRNLIVVILSLRPIALLWIEKTFSSVSLLPNSIHKTTTALTFESVFCFDVITLDCAQQHSKELTFEKFYQEPRQWRPWWRRGEQQWEQRWRE